MTAKHLTRREAQKLGFTVDTSCYPWWAYKEHVGRFGTTHIEADRGRPIRTPGWPRHH